MDKEISVGMTNLEVTVGNIAKTSRNKIFSKLGTRGFMVVC